MLTRPHIYKSNMSASSAPVSLASCFLPHETEFHAFTSLYVWQVQLLDGVKDIKQTISTVSSSTGRIPEPTGLIQKEIYNERTWQKSQYVKLGSCVQQNPEQLCSTQLREMAKPSRTVAAEDSENKGTFPSRSFNGCANMRVYIFVLVLNKDKLHRKLET
jgi:hypothetical protein